MFTKRTLSFLIVISMMTVLFSGCGKKSQVKYSYDTDYTIHKLDSQVLSENDALKLTWDNETKGISLEEKKTGRIWSNVLEGEETSTLDCYLQDVRLFSTDFISSIDALRKDKISAEKIKDGIKLTYYFDEKEIAIPVSYTLREDSMCIAINGSEIRESGDEFRLRSAVPSPHLTEVKQETEDAYIFLSDGIGAIIDTKADVDGEKELSTGSGNVSALATVSNVNPGEKNGIRAYGLKSGDYAMFCIAEEEAAAVSVKVSAGDMASSYSAVNATYCFIDVDSVRGKATTSGDVDLISDRKQSTVSVGFYPLSGEDADYNGMAKCYRRYLEKRGLISSEKKDFSNAYAVTALGGVMSTSSVAGVPTMTLKKATGFSEAQEIIESLVKETGLTPVARLKGYGETGLNIGKIAGGFKFASLFGSDKDRKALEDACAKEGISLYTDFDVVRFSESGAGFSYTNDAAKTATLHAAEFAPVNVPLRDYNDKLSYRLLARGKIDSALDKVLKFCEKKDISGICLSYFGQNSYSDYNDIKYAVAGQMEQDVKDGILKLKKSNNAVAGSASAYYAAGLVDTVFDAPLDKKGKYQFAKEIPFYQMVFAGVTPMYSAPINTASNPQEKLMLAASTGTGLGFAVIKNFENEYMETGVEKLYACGYAYCKDLIVSSLKAYNGIYQKVAGVKIDRYEFINDAVTKTVFENGVTVYANHTSKEQETPVGKLDAYGFAMDGEAKS